MMRSIVDFIAKVAISMGGKHDENQHNQIDSRLDLLTIAINEEKYCSKDIICVSFVSFDHVFSRQTHSPGTAPGRHACYGAQHLMSCQQQIGAGKVKAALSLPAGLALALCAALPLRAQDLSDLSLEQLLTVEVSTASRYPQPLRQAPSPVRVITADDIRQYAWRTLGEALSSLPGFYLSDDRAYQYLGARGFLIPGDYSTRFLLLLDGQRLNDNLFEQAPFGENFPLDLSLVERIEVVPGPGSAIYGSNAVFGVINVITRAAEGPDASRLAATVTSDGWREWQATTRRRLGEDGPTLSASVTSGSKGARDLRIPGAGAPGADVARGLDSADRTRAWLSISQSGLTFSAWAVQREVRPPSALYGTLFNDPRLQLSDHSYGASLSLERAIGEDLQFSGRLALQQQGFRGTYPYDDGVGGSYLNRDNARGAWWSADTRLLYTGLRNHKLVAGIDLQQDRRAQQWNADLPVGSGPVFDINPTSWRAGAYLQDEWAFAPDWRLSAGLRHDRYGMDIEHTSPRLGLVWSASAATTVKLLAGMAHRVPSAFERWYAVPGYLPNPALLPEQIRTIELAAEHALSASQRFGVSLYQYRIKQLIQQVVPDGGTDVQFRNAAGAVSSGGIELSWTAGTPGAGSLVASLALNQTRDDAGERVTNSPRWMAKLRAAHPLPAAGWQLAAEADAIGPRRIASDGGWQALDTQWWINAVLSARSLLPGVHLQLRVLNLLDRDLRVPVGEAVTPLLPFHRRALQLTLSHEF